MLRDLFGHFADFFAEFFKKEEVWFLLLFASFAGILVIPNVLSFLLWLIGLLWWLWLFLILFPVTKSVWLFWRNELYKQGIQHVVFELRMPREILKNPRAMEQVLATINGARNSPGNFKETYWDGEITLWFSLEIISIGGEVHFYVRTPEKHRNAIEAAFFAYYPDVEVVEVEDYVEKLVPETLEEVESQQKEMWSGEYILSREDAYPIKTYPSFEDPAEERTFDPISTFLEALNNVKGQSFIGLQYIIEPAGRSWKDAWNGLLKQLQASPKSAPVPEGEFQAFAIRSPGQTEVLKAVEANLSKPAFATLTRTLYIAPKGDFNFNYVYRSLAGALNQFSALHLNSFRMNSAVMTKVSVWDWPHLFAKRRSDLRKRRSLYNYRFREIPPKTSAGLLLTSTPLNANASKLSVLTTESVATLFHPPTSMVLTAPHVKRSESKKTGPPAGLAIFGEEGEIQKYL